MIHRFRVYILERRNSIIFFLVSTVMFTLLILSALILNELRDQSNRNERVMKGLSCILLILPEDRTSEKISECIRINNEGKDGNEFMFKTITSLEATTVDSPAPDFVELLKGQEGQKGDTGATGPKGADGAQGPVGSTGAVGTAGINGVAGEVIKGDKGDQGEPGAPGREVEFRYNTPKARVEWRYVGDDNWQILVQGCEITNTCTVEP